MELVITIENRGETTDARFVERAGQAFSAALVNLAGRKTMRVGEVIVLQSNDKRDLAIIDRAA